MNFDHMNDQLGSISHMSPRCRPESFRQEDIRQISPRITTNREKPKIRQKFEVGTPVPVHRGSARSIAASERVAPSFRQENEAD
jgi:hypothetical protein